jgi:Zn-dependent protease with chaperone function
MSDTATFYPPAPADAPADLTAPTAGYRARVLIVLVSLILFVALYVGLVIGSAFLSYYSFSHIGDDSPRSTTYYGRGYRPSRSRSSDPTFWLVVVGICSGALCVFLVKGLFKRSPSDPSLRVEITEKEQPVLFAFIRRLCRDTRAPFPRRVFLSPEVNAAVFYNSSFLSLVWPTRKNLVIGLGLVNRLNLSEFKAVLAHEFGHFSQNSMKLGSYVYTSNRIIAGMVFGRDWLDDLVGVVRRLDLRIAIFAWAFTGVLWGLRKMLQGVFRAINFANSSLSRQMEFNADLVAVSVTGSDALIHCLARLDFANEALSQAWEDLSTAADHQLFSRDLFYHQTRSAEYLRGLRQNPRLGEPPSLPEEGGRHVQVFEPGDDGTPRMWATHPSNYDREQNAKRNYLRCSIDERSPWVLFQNPEAVREQVTRRFYQVARKLEDVKLSEPEVVQAFIDDEHVETTYHARYHGMYDARYVRPGDVAALVREVPAEYDDPVRLGAAHAELYTPELKERTERFTKHQEEYQVLAGLAQGTLQLKGKDFPFRDGRYRATDVKRLLAQVDKDLDDDRAWLAALDRRVFLVHYAMARILGPETCRELEERYRFHLAVQESMSVLADHHQQVQLVLGEIGGQRELSEGQFQSALGIFRQAYRALGQALRKADDLLLPALKNLTPGVPLGPFLLDSPLVRELGADAKSLNGQWIGEFLTQLGGVLDKARRIHFKSLGGILALQERIAEQWAARNAVAAPPSTSAAEIG